MVDLCLARLDHLVPGTQHGPVKVLHEALMSSTETKTHVVGVSSHRQKSGMKIFSRSTKATRGCPRPGRKQSFVASHEWPSEREVSNAQPSPALAISANGVLSERGPGHSLRCSCFSLSMVGLSEGDRDVVALEHEEEEEEEEG